MLSISHCRGSRQVSQTNPSTNNDPTNRLLPARRAVIESSTLLRPLTTTFLTTLQTTLLNPTHFFTSPSYRPMLLLYTGTYLAANASDTLTSLSSTPPLPATSTSTSAPKLAAVTATNLLLSLHKDTSFARAFGASAARFPAVAYPPFIVRDVITLTASFALPGVLAPHLPPELERVVSRTTAAQLAAPALSQWAATPLHLFALDLHARRGRLGYGERWERVRKGWVGASVARMARVLPAYGVGAVVNGRVREGLMGRFG